MQSTLSQSDFFGKEKINKILIKTAPPVMLAQLLQALYNIVSSMFVSRYSESGITALSIIYPIQLLMIALAVGTGVGINTVMAARLGTGRKEASGRCAGVGTPLAIAMWFIFAVVCWFIMPSYAKMSTSSPEVISDVIIYGRIVCLFSFGLFLESIWTKVLQANGDMKTPMIAQIVGAVINVILNPILIFGMFGITEMGIAGAAIATVIGQIAAAIVVMKGGYKKSPKLTHYKSEIAAIFRLGTPNILMQSAYTFYILGLNLILATFSDGAVTALGLYYKWQTFFFIPLGAMQTCIVPIISYNFAARKIKRCKDTLNLSIIAGVVLMAVGALCFEILPVPMLKVFTKDPSVIEIGRIAFRIIALSFIPMVTSLIYPVFLQAIGSGVKSSFLTVIRTVLLFVPLAYLFSLIGLEYFWLTFPLTEIITSIVGFIYYNQFLERPYVKNAPVMQKSDPIVITPSKPGVIITIARQHGSSGKEIGRIVAEKLGIPFYYKEMTALAAQQSGLDKEFISSLNKNAPKALYNLYLSTRVVRLAVVAQHKIITEIAENGSCVIVGRAADFVLNDNPHIVKIFIGADEEYRKNRVMEIYGDTLEEAEDNIRRSDKARAAYYRHISGKRWGDKDNYDLYIDSSNGVEESSKTILEFINKKDNQYYLEKN